MEILQRLNVGQIEDLEIIEHQRILFGHVFREKVLHRAVFLDDSALKLFPQSEWMISQRSIPDNDIPSLYL